MAWQLQFAKQLLFHAFNKCLIPHMTLRERGKSKILLIELIEHEFVCDSLVLDKSTGRNSGEKAEGRSTSLCGAGSELTLHLLFPCGTCRGMSYSHPSFSTATCSNIQHCNSCAQTQPTEPSRSCTYSKGTQQPLH